MAKEKCKNCDAYAGKLLIIPGSIAKYKCNKCGQEFCHKCKGSSGSCPKCGTSNPKRNGYLS